MQYPYRFQIFAMTSNYEEYAMVIVAKTPEQAQEVAKKLCDDLGLILQSCHEED